MKLFLVNNKKICMTMILNKHTKMHDNDMFENVLYNIFGILIA